MTTMPEAPAVAAAVRDIKSLEQQLVTKRDRLAKNETDRVVVRNTRTVGRADHLLELDDEAADLKAEIAALDARLVEARQHRNTVAEAARIAFLTDECTELDGQLGAFDAQLRSAAEIVAAIAGQRRAALERRAAAELELTGRPDADRTIVLTRHGAGVIQALEVVSAFMSRELAWARPSREELARVTTPIGELVVRFFDRFYAKENNR